MDYLEMAREMKEMETAQPETYEDDDLMAHYYIYPDGYWVRDWPDYLQDHNHIAAFSSFEVDTLTASSLANEIEDSIAEREAQLS